MEKKHAVIFITLALLVSVIGLSGCIGTSADIDNDGIPDAHDDYIGPPVESPFPPVEEIITVEGKKFAQRFKIEQNFLEGIKFYFTNCHEQRIKVEVEEAKDMSKPTGQVVRDEVIRTLPDSGNAYVTFTFNWRYFTTVEDDYWIVIYAMENVAGIIPDFDISFSHDDYENGYAMQYENNMWDILDEDLGFDLLFAYDPPPEDPGQLIEFTFSTDSNVPADLHPYRENIGGNSVWKSVWKYFNLGRSYRVYKLEGVVQLKEDFSGCTELRFFTNYEDSASHSYWLAFVTMCIPFEDIEFDFWINHEGFSNRYAYDGQYFQMYSTREYETSGTLYVKEIQR